VSPTEDCLANTLAVRFPGLRADDLVVAFDLEGLCVSTGSACSSGKQEVSHVFRAMELEKPHELLRISLDWTLTANEVDKAGDIIENALKNAEREAA